MTNRESSIRRAWRDTARAQKSAWFTWLGGTLLVTTFGVWAGAQSASTADIPEIAIRSGLGGLAGLSAAVSFIFTLNVVLAPYRQRNQAWTRLEEIDDLAAKRWYFRIGELRFNRRSLEKAEHTIAIDLMVANTLNENASISHFVLEAASSDGNEVYVEPTQRDRVGAPIISGRDEMFAPLYFRPKETKVGQVTFFVTDLGRIGSHHVPMLYIRDEVGTEYRLRLEGRTMLRIASISRKEDYPN